MGEFPRKADGRRVFTPEFKREVVQQILKGEKTLAELSRELDIHPTVLRSWKRHYEAGASTAVAAMVVSSVPLSLRTGRTHRDSWSNASPFGLPQEGTGFATERDAIVGAWRQRGVHNVIFLVADVHHPELIRHHPTPAFSFHEFIAGPLSATQGRPRALDAGLHLRSLFARGGVNSYGEIVIEPGHLTVRLLDEDGIVLFTHTFGPE